MITIGAIAAYIFLPIVTLILIGCALWCWSYRDGYERSSALFGTAACVLSIPVWLVLWWWGMAFTTSGDYHAWNTKQGKVEQIGKRLISSGDNGMSERYVLTLDGVPYGVDDTRASIAKVGNVVTLRCKKDYQWAVPRESHGWVCRWIGKEA